MDISSHKERFLKNGWFVLDCPDKGPILEARAFLEKRVRELLGQEISLEEYHTVVSDDERHTQLQIMMTQAFREQEFGLKILKGQLPFFYPFLGYDLFGQANPYLRMTRPFKPQDNIGFHRDTFYGGSPYELSVLVPFVDLPAASSLSILSGSHLHSEEAYPTHQIENPDQAVRKGSAKHQLGFLYAPKVMDNTIESQMEAIPLKVGEVLIFSLAAVHGSILNRGSVCRWSSDMRIMNAFAPVDLSARPDYYKPLNYSVVTQAAQHYFYANRKETRDHVELELCDTAPRK